MKNIILTLLFISIYTLNIYSQNTGYAGKKFLLQSNIVNGARKPHLNIGTQYIISRGTTVSLNYSYQNYQSKQYFTKPEYVMYKDIQFQGVFSSSRKNPPNWNNKTKLREKANIESSLITLELRTYLKKGIPAPNGLYFCTALRYSNSNVSGNYWKSLTQDLKYDADNVSVFESGYYDDELLDYNYSSVHSIGLDFGMGHQYFLTKRITIGPKGTLNFSYFNIGGEDSRTYTSGVAKYYGSNLFSHQSLKSDDRIDFRDYSSKHRTKMATGFSFFIDIAFLIF
jgi:hypothetical protein